MNKFPFFSSLFLFSCLTMAQTFQWQWAERGGGNRDFDNRDNWPEYELINDIEIDDQGNHYFLAQIAGGVTSYGSNVFTNYTTTPTGRDVYLVSTDCQGNFRWQKTFGNNTADYALGLGVDAMGRVTISGMLQPETFGFGNMTNFDTDVVIDSGNDGALDPGPHNQSLFLIQYDSQGNFQWLVQPERDVIDITMTFPLPYEHHVESDGTIHWLVRMGSGTHPEVNYTDSGTHPGGDFIIARFDAQGQYLGHTLTTLGQTAGSGVRITEPNVRFNYDPVIDQYYIATHDTNTGGRPTYDGNPPSNWTFLVALDPAGNTLWRIDDDGPGNVAIGGITVDDQSNIYLTGSSGNYLSGSLVNSSFAGYVFDQQINNGGEIVPYVLSLDSSGNLRWGSHGDSFNQYLPLKVVVSGNEVATVGEMSNTSTWDGQTFTRPQNSLSDPVVVRLDRNTGSVLAIHDIMGTLGRYDQATAIAADQYGNYALGGWMKGSLFTGAQAPLPSIDLAGGRTDFFVARIARTDCNGTPLSTDGVSALDAIRLFPNPATNSVRLINHEGSTIYEILSMDGRSVSSGSISGGEAMDISTLPSGIYFVRLDRGTRTLRLVKR